MGCWNPPLSWRRAKYENKDRKKAGSVRLRRRQRAADRTRTCPDWPSNFRSRVVKARRPRRTRGGIGQVSTGPLIRSRLGLAPLRAAEIASPATSTVTSKVHFSSASDRKMLSLRASARNRKCTNSTKLVLPAPLRDWRSLAPSLVREQDVQPGLKVRVLKEQGRCQPGKS